MDQYLHVTYNKPEGLFFMPIIKKMHIDVARLGKLRYVIER